MKFILGFISGVACSMLIFWLLERQVAPSPETDAPIAQTNTANNPQDFDVFFERFHTDSLYQIEHVLFPLQGLPPDVDSITLAEGRFYWQKSDWRMHRPFDDMDGTFIRELIPFGDDIMLEQIKDNSGQYGMQRRFAYFDDGWQLIYYSAMNKLRMEE
ncbi:MAG: hypothetical protein AAFP19_00765 [Bacteroidota bacterium]